MNFGLRLDEILKTYKQMVIDDEYNIKNTYTESDTKQALTSLIKELVARAKPEYAEILPEDYDMFGDYNHVKRMRNATIDEFEQNLLKVLGYEDEK